MTTSRDLHKKTIDRMNASVKGIMRSATLHPEIHPDEMLRIWPRVTGQVWVECATDGYKRD